MPRSAFGPILQFRGCDAGVWRVSALCRADASGSPPVVSLGLPGAAPTPVAGRLLATLPVLASRPTDALWRHDFQVPLTNAAQAVGYTVDGTGYSFQVPARDAIPRMAYGSCNGFSDPKLMKQVSDKNDRWAHLLARHQAGAYELLLLGGDQVYSDSLWEQVPTLKDWSDRSGDDRWQANVTRRMSQEIDAFFTRLYLERWAQASMRDALAAIPTVMMWDDHDIFDGWGSYPAERHYSAVYQGIYEIARSHYRLFQQQLAPDERHPCAVGNGDGLHLGFAGLGGLDLLAPDLRSERMPREPSRGVMSDQIVGSASWEALYTWLDARPKAADGEARHLLLMSSIPVTYLDLGGLERALNALPGQQELEDDLRDHWRSAPHQQERQRLVQRLLRFAAAKNCRVTIVSGDVHVGALGVIESTREGPTGHAGVINQLVSTGIVHPAPPAMARWVLERFAEGRDPIDRGINGSMLPIAGHGSYLIGARNWLALEPDTQGRLWANWHVEGQHSPLTKVIHPIVASPA